MRIHNTMTVVIPSLDPDDHLIALVKQCIQLELSNILIVNDGSDESYDPIFDQAKQLGAQVITHKQNRGKGSALKSAFQYLSKHYDDSHIIVTADSDGQHVPEDILKIAKVSSNHPNALVLGVRDFHQEGIPFRSRFGNVATRFLMKMLCGISIRDTQTGLRSFPLSLAKQFLSIEGDRFEYEFHMLFYCKEHHISMIQETIHTVYLAENESSHFQPLKDSYLIYRVFFRFLISSFASSLLDILLFSVIIYLYRSETSSYIWSATVIARIVSSVFNFMMNKHSVFRDEQKSIIVPIKYFSLCIIQMCASAMLVSFVYANTHMMESFCKILVDVVLFLISFVIQREWIFTD